MDQRQRRRQSTKGFYFWIGCFWATIGSALVWAGIIKLVVEVYPWIK